jgi:alpha-galactosidase
LQRVYIQWGTSLFFPANAMAQHIGGVPYWNIGGRTFTGRFLMDVGLEIPLNWDYASRVFELRK